MHWPMVFKSWRILVFFLTPIVLLPLPLIGGTKVAGTGYVLIVNIIYFVTLPIPLCVTTLLPLVLYPLLGVHSAQQVASWCVNDPVLMQIGSLIFGMAIEGSNLHIRIALKTLLFLGPRPERLLLAFMVVSFLLSMWISNIGVVVMLIPIVFAMQKELQASQLSNQTAVQDRQEADKEDTQNSFVTQITAGMILAIVYGSTMGGMTTLVGSHPSIMFKLVADQLYGEAAKVNFATHMLVCAPLAISAAIFTWLFMTLVYAPGYVAQLWKERVFTRQQASFEDHLTKTLQKQHEKLGGLNFGEGSVIIFFCLLVLLWFFRNPPGFPGWGTWFPTTGYVSDGTVAMTVAMILFIWPTDIKLLWREGKNIPLVQWRPHMTEHFPWELLLFSMGTTALSQGTAQGGLPNWIVSILQPLEVIPSWVMMILITIVISIITEFVSNSIIVVVLLPILAKFAERTYVNPIYYMMPVTMSAMLSFMTPVASNITALIHASGAVTVRQLYLTGIIPKLACILLIILFVNTVGDAVFDVHTFPEWAANRTGITL